MAPHKWAERFVDFKGTEVPEALGGGARTKEGFSGSYCRGVMTNASASCPRVRAAEESCRFAEVLTHPCESR